MFKKMVQFFYPDIQNNEIKKSSLLALAFVFTIGTYWIMRLLKDVILYKIAFPSTLGWSPDTGRLWIPAIKSLSPIFIFFLLMIYSKLVDTLKKQNLFYVVTSFYAVVFSGITAIMLIRNLHGDLFLGSTVLGLTGIIGYLFTESFGSIVTVLFWSFTISSCQSDQAKRIFPFIIAMGQLGSIFGSSLILIKTDKIWYFYGIVVICLISLIFTIKYLVNSIPASQLHDGKREKMKKHNIFSGLKLLLVNPYLIGVFAISTLYEVAIVIVEYQMDSQASIIFNDLSFKWFKGIYGISINSLAFLIALLGTSYIIKRFSTRICLLIYPVSFALALFFLYGYYIHGATPTNILWATFSVMLLVKAVAYAINNPMKEIMYIPTSKDAKFKTKGIIDTLGARTVKVAGAQISGSLNVANNVTLSIKNLMVYGSLISLGFIGVWIIAAIYVGTKNKELIDKNQIIE